jgi:hypothetical protein
MLWYQYVGSTKFWVGRPCITLLCNSIRLSVNATEYGRACFVKEDYCKLKLKTKLRSRSPQANYTDQATASCRRSYYQTLRVEGVAWLTQRIPMADNLGFLGGSRYFFNSSSSSVVLTRLSGSRSGVMSHYWRFGVAYCLCSGSQCRKYKQGRISHKANLGHGLGRSSRGGAYIQKYSTEV